MTDASFTPVPGTFAFRVRFHLHAGDWIKLSDNRVSLPPCAGSTYTVMSAVDGEKIESARVLTIRAGGFANEASAREAGERVVSAICLAGATVRAGIDVGRYRRQGGFTNAGIERFTPTGMKGRTDVHGLDVFADEPNLRFLSFDADAAVGHHGPRFLAIFEAALARCANVDPRTRLALEIYGLSHFEASQRARFVALMSVVEALADRRSRSAAVRTFVKECMAAATAKLPADEEGDVRSGLGNLKTESIKSACRRLIATRLGDGRVAEFMTHYGVRSTLLHDGEAPDVDFGTEAPKLDGLVSDLLRSILGMPAQESFPIDAAQ